MKVSPIKKAVVEINALTCKEGLVEAVPTGMKSILIEGLYATTPGNGWGLRTIRRITKILDETECVAVAYLDQDSPTGLLRLEKLYRHFGFQPDGFLKLKRIPKPCHTR